MIRSKYMIELKFYNSETDVIMNKLFEELTKNLKNKIVLNNKNIFVFLKNGSLAIIKSKVVDDEK